MGTSTSRQSAPTSPVRDSNFVLPRHHPSGNDRLSTSNDTAITTSPPDQPNEYPHLGSVQVNLSWLNPNAIRSNDTDNSYLVTAKGGVFYGSSAPSPLVMNELENVRMTPTEYPLLDSRAHQLLIAYDNGWNAISSPEVFSRHTGTCLIIGDRTNQGRGHEIKLGDCFRLGSVGVVVSELKKPNEKEERLDTKRLQYLREEALHFDNDGDEAVLAAKEENGVLNREGGEQEEEMVSPTARDNISGNLFCYMCYESHDTPEDHLVAPCACKGDTRYLHVQCLQKWYQSSLSGWRSLVIRTTGSGAPACKICGMAYKTTLTNQDGVKTNLLEAEHPGPYMSLVVVTRHDTSPELFNTKFRLNFGPGYRIGSTEEVNDDPEMNPSELTIGRSSMCNMVLDYRTVSTVHAKLFFRDGQFLLQDARSSNGTMLYLQGPLKLPMNQPVRLRMGRSTLAIQARRSLTASIRTVFTKHKYPPCKASLDELQRIMALAPSMLSKNARMFDKDQLRNNFMNEVNIYDAANRTGGSDSGTPPPRRLSPRVSPHNSRTSPSRSPSPSPYVGGRERERDIESRRGATIEDILMNGEAAAGADGSSASRLLVTEQMLRDIFRHHQSQLPQGIYTDADVTESSSNINSNRDMNRYEVFDNAHLSTIPAAVQIFARNNSGLGGGSSVAVSDGVNIDSALILGERPHTGGGGSSHRQHATVDNSNSNGDGESEGGRQEGGGEESLSENDDSAAVALPHTSTIYNHQASSNNSPTPAIRQAREALTASRSEAATSSVNNLAALTTATLSSVDADGNPLINQAEFLLQLGHQLQTIELCVQEATTMALATVGAYTTAEDRQREHTEMRIQRAIISQSIQKDEVSGKSIVDNESILLAATVISTKASAIAARTTGKESKKADKVAKRYSVIADKANEMIIKKAIRQSANSTSCSLINGQEGVKCPVGGRGLLYEEDEDENGYSHSYIDQDQDQDQGEGQEEEEAVEYGAHTQAHMQVPANATHGTPTPSTKKLLDEKEEKSEEDDCEGGGKSLVNFQHGRFKDGVNVSPYASASATAFASVTDATASMDGAEKQLDTNSSTRLEKPMKVTEIDKDMQHHFQQQQQEEIKAASREELDRGLSGVEKLEDKELQYAPKEEESQMGSEKAAIQEQLSWNEDVNTREAQALKVLEKISSTDLTEGGGDQKEVAMAVLLQAAQAAVAGGGPNVSVTSEDVDEVVQAIREICERRRLAAASAGSSSSSSDNDNTENNDDPAKDYSNDNDNVNEIESEMQKVCKEEDKEENVLNVTSDVNMDKDALS